MSSDVLALALAEFRTDWGIAANPEQHPDIWAIYLADAEQVIADSQDAR